MAFNGYLLKVGNYEFPLKYIEYKSYKVTKRGQDLDSYRDADGELRRTALAHTVNTVSFKTLPNLTNKEVTEIMTNISKNYINTIEKKVSVTAYLPETDSYETQDMYIPDIQFTIKKISDTIITYEGITMEFIGY